MTLQTETLSSALTELDKMSLAWLDFDPELPCEHSRHGERHQDQPAQHVIAVLPCPGCGHKPPVDEYLICDSGWVAMWQNGVRCTLCPYGGARDEFLVYVRSLND